ncbi:MAG: PadR family transcriptional regulator [Clostridia bacterium]|nr:PadR family transcriptional regulator [Clostridia bacterium]
MADGGNKRSIDRKLLSGDMLRGHIDTIILRVLIDGNKYGVEIKKEINSKTNGLYNPNEQSLYSAFHRLEQKGLIKGVWGNEYVGATRKYYTITNDGVMVYESNLKEWNTAKRLIDLLIV